MAPSKQRITEIFSHLASGEHEKFYSHVDPDVDWTVMSQSTLGGRYSSLADFRAKTVGRLGPLLDPSTPLRFQTHNVIGGGDGEEWSTVEMKHEGKAKNGMRYDQTYAWCVRWGNGEERIVEVRAYIDTGLMDRVIEANEH